mmetsp:Transcript_14841/g.60645  ORF Transcript_14841/g.60645 Transcript_14841/m.60645 type:complete len:225 (-) Transcript_14841:1818-2492(-)
MRRRHRRQVRPARVEQDLAGELWLGGALLRLRPLVRRGPIGVVLAIARGAGVSQPRRLLQQEHRADIHVHGRVRRVERPEPAVRRVPPPRRGADDAVADDLRPGVHHRHGDERGVPGERSAVEGGDAGRRDRRVRGVRRLRDGSVAGDSRADTLPVPGAGGGRVPADAHLHDVSRGAVHRGGLGAGRGARVVQRVRPRRRGGRVGVLSARRDAVAGVHGGSGWV